MNRRWLKYLLLHITYSVTYVTYLGGLVTAKVAGSTQPVPLSDNNLGQVIYAHLPLSPK